MRTLPQMGLVMWEQVTDLYDHVQLANNFAKLDAHDHTPGRGTLLTTQSMEAGSITNPLLAANAITSAKIEDGTIKPADLESSLQEKIYTSRAALSIATEEARTNVAYGLLATPDTLTVTLPEKGLINIWFQGMWKETNSNAGQAAIFIGANQLKAASGTATAPEAQKAVCQGTNVYCPLSSSEPGLLSGAAGAGYTGDVTTGQAIATAEASGGVCAVFAAAGTYAISIQYLATAGTVTVKNRKLWVEAKSFKE